MMDWKTEKNIRRFGPWCIFAVVIATAYGLHWLGNIPGRAFGFAEGEEISVSALYRGRIAVVAVLPGQDVKQGQVVAKLATAAVDSQIEVVQAEINQLEAEAESGRLDAKRSQLLDVEQFETAVEKNRLLLAREQAALEKSEAEAAVVSAEATRLKRLVKQGLATREELATIEARHVTLQREIKERPNAIRLLRLQLTKAMGRASAVDDKSVGLVSTALNGKLEVAKRQLEMLQLERQGMTLYAPVDGNITFLHGMVGEVVNPGDPVIGMVASQSSRVIACVSEEEALKVREGGLATLQVRGENTRRLSGHIIALGPLVNEVPIRCRSIPNRPAWGRQVTLQLDDSATLIPGQSLTVQFDFGSKARQVKSQVAASAGSPLRLMDIPESLLKLSQFEPSGLVWRSDLARYIVVSDDTGHKKKLENSPWVFSMSASGRVDPDPILVVGIDEFNDLESITMDSNNGMYILASQGYSKKGKRSRARTVMLFVEDVGKWLEAKNVQYLAQGLDAAGLDFLAALGIPQGTRDLEIEGMVYRAGNLYLGLKSPLDHEGKSLIWKMENPKKFLSSGDLSQAGLSLWARVALPAKSDGQEVPGGIADLLFLPDGGLLISSTPSMGGGDIVNGFLSYAKKPQQGTFAVEPIEEFIGSKPEGLSLSPTPGQVMVVFDAGSGGLPSWVSVPWP